MEARRGRNFHPILDAKASMKLKSRGGIDNTKSSIFFLFMPQSYNFFPKEGNNRRNPYLCKLHF
jgi:hypothetical protein